MPNCSCMHSGLYVGNIYLAAALAIACFLAPSHNCTAHGADNCQGGRFQTHTAGACATSGNVGSSNHFGLSQPRRSCSFLSASGQPAGHRAETAACSSSLQRFRQKQVRCAQFECFAFWPGSGTLFFFLSSSIRWNIFLDPL